MTTYEQSVAFTGKDVKAVITMVGTIEEIQEALGETMRVLQEAKYRFTANKPNVKICEGCGQ